METTIPIFWQLLPYGTLIVGWLIGRMGGSATLIDKSEMQTFNISGDYVEAPWNDPDTIVAPDTTATTNND